MEELAGNRYDFKRDLENLRNQFDSKVYKEDEAIYTKNVFLALSKITDGRTITEFLERKVSYSRMTTATYLYIKDVVKAIETDEKINFSKYSDIIDVDSKHGVKQNPIVIRVRRNRETEFIKLLCNLEIPGMLSLLDTLAKLERV